MPDRLLKGLLLGLCLLATAVVCAAEPADDGQIRARLESVLAAVDGLEAVGVQVESGVVTLDGKVTSEALEARALDLARAMDGVLTVNDRLSVNLRVGDRIEPVMQRFRGRLQDLLGTLPLILLAAGIVVLFLLAGRSVSRWDWLFRRLVRNSFLRDLTRTVVFACIAFLGILIALELLDATALLGAALGTAGVFGLALGFALRDTIENYLAGVLLSLRQPFSPYDHVALEGHEGQVLRLTSRATILLTFDGNHVRIPNAVVFKSTLINYSRNVRRRFEFEVGVDAGVDLAAARDLATRTLQDMRSVLDDPSPQAFIKTLGDSNVVIVVQGWVDQSTSSFVKVKSEAIRLVKEAFDHADYEMPEPIYRLRVQNIGAAEHVQPEQASAPRAIAASPHERHQSALHAGEEGDTAVEDDIRRQVAEERRQNPEDDLLNEAAPKE